MGSIIPYITQPTRVFLIAHFASRKSHVSQSHISSHKFITYLCLKKLKLSRILFWGDLCHRLFWSHQQKIQGLLCWMPKISGLLDVHQFMSRRIWRLKKGPLNLPSSKVGGLLASKFATLSSCWWLKSGVHQLRLVVCPTIYKVLYIPGGAGVQPSTVSTAYILKPKSNPGLRLWQFRIILLFWGSR